MPDHLALSPSSSREPLGASRRAPPSARFLTSLGALALILGACAAGPDEGTIGGACFANGTCNAGLRCEGRSCVVAPVDDAGVAPDPDGGLQPDGGRARIDGGGLDDGGREDPDSGRVDSDAGRVDAATPEPDGGGDADVEDPDGGPGDPRTGTLGGVTVRSVSPRAAVIDPSGTPHVVVAGDALRHYWHDGSAWRDEVVTPHADVASVVLDPSGALVVAFVDRHLRNGPRVADAERLALARQTPGGWVLEDIEAELPRCATEHLRAPDLAVGADGAIHVVYFRRVDPRSTIRVASRAPAGGWSHATVRADVDDYLPHVEVAVDAGGEPMIAWNEFGTLWFAKRSSGSWSVPLLVRDEGFEQADRWDLVADAAGRATFVYFTPSSTAGVAATRILREGSSTFSEISCPVDSEWPSYSAAVLADGSVAFSLREYDAAEWTWRPAVAVATATSCAVIDRVDAPDARFGDPLHTPSAPLETHEELALAVRGEQRLLVQLERATGELVAYRATTASAPWERSVLTRTRVTGAGVAVAVAPGGRAFAVGLELQAGAIEGLAEGPGGVDPMAPVTGLPLRELVGLDAVAHPTGDLLVVLANDRSVTLHRFDGGGWLPPSTVATGGWGPVRVVLGPGDRPAVVRRDAIHEFDGARWVPSEYGASAVGQHAGRPDLRYDSAGLPVVGFLAAGSNEASVARRDATGSWSTSSIEPTYGGPTALALDASDHAHVLYVQTRTDPYELRYAHDDSGTWEVETVEGLAAIGRSRSPLGVEIEVADDGRVVALFHSFRAGTARLGVRDPSGWSVVSLGEGEDGWFPDLALDGSDAVVAWHDRASGDLEVARVPLP